MCQPLSNKWLTHRKAADPRGFSYVLSVITAATENKDQRQNDDPGAAIVKGVAETVVVIHMRSSLKIRDVLPTLPSYVGGWGSVHAVPRRSPWRCGRFAPANPVRRAPQGGRQGSDARHFFGQSEKNPPEPLAIWGKMCYTMRMTVSAAFFALSLPCGIQILVEEDAPARGA